tara:strand:- start:376 stop:804 length:429 start_codon:yes stop_codon:yes gene_type:complete
MYNKILVPVDLAHKEQLSKLIDTASLLVDQKQGGIHLLYVDPILIHKAGFPQLDTATYKTHQNEALGQLRSLVDSLTLDAVKVTYSTREGTAHEQILEEAKKQGADAIVLMSRRPGLASYFIGSNAERVVRHAKCSVFVIRN